MEVEDVRSSVRRWVFLNTTRWFTVLLAAAAFAQGPQSGPTFQTKANVVLVPVVVRNGSGQTIGNLTREDFELFDKGRRQRISSFAVVERSAGVSKNESTGAGTTIAPEQRRNAATIAGGSRPERYVVYVFDDLNALFTELTYVRQAAVGHFKGDFPVTDRAAIVTFSGRTALGFTSDRAKLEETVNKLLVRPRMGHGPGMPCPDVSYYLANLIVNQGSDPRPLEAVTRQTMECAHVPWDLAKNMAEAAARQELLIGAGDTRIALDTLKRAIRLVADMPGQRLIVLASPGFYALTQEERGLLAGVLDLAARSNVTISTLSARGVDTTGLMEASQSRPMSSLERQYYRESARASGDILSDMAEATGGTLFRNNNDLTLGFARVASLPEHSYVLGFSPEGLKANGSFHRLKIRLLDRKGVTVQARNGYYDLKPASQEEMASTELHDAVFSQDEISDLPVDVAMQVSKSGTDDAKLTVVAKVHLTWLHFRNVAQRSRDSLTIVSAVFDRDGGYVIGAQKTVNLALRAETLHQADPGVNVQSDFAMKPGAYRVRVVVRDAQGSAMSAYNGAVTIR